MDNLPVPLSRVELYLAKACGMDVTVPEAPESRLEQYLAILAGDTSIEMPAPLSLTEQWLAYILGVTPDPLLAVEGACYIGNQKVDVRYFAVAAGMPGAVLPPAPQNRKEQYFANLNVGPSGVLKYVTGTNIALTDVVSGIASLENVYGGTYQQAYSGKNLFNVPSPYSIVGGGTDIKNLFTNYEIGKTYTISCGDVTKGGENNPVIRIVGASTEYLTLAPNSSTTFTINSEITNIYTYSNGSSYSDSVGKTSVVGNLMVEEGLTPTAYEPYVGGIPSPRPDYPQTINVVSGEQTINVRGKNMFNVNKPLENKYLDSSGGWVTSTYSYVNQEYTVTGSSELSFSFAGKNGSPTIRVGEFKADGTFIKRTLVTTALTLALDALTNKIIFSVDNLSPNYFDDLQIELGSSPTSYQPYTSQSYTLDLGAIELCKIGTYQDYIYKNGDDWYLHNEISKVMLASTIEWVAQSYGGYTYVSGFNQHDFDNASISGSSITVLSDQFTPVSWNDRTLNYPNSVYINVSDQSHPRLELRNTSWANAESVVAWFTSHPATVYFALATPTDTKITDATLIGQLEALNSAPLPAPVVFIAVDAADANLPGPLKISYYGEEE